MGPGGRRGWLKTKLPGPGAVVDPIDPESFFRVKDTWTIGCPIQRASSEPLGVLVVAILFYK